MAICPRCKQDMPLLSKMCPICGHVEQGEGTDMSVSEFADALERNLRDIKQIPEPSFGKSMSQLTFVMFPIAAVFMLAAALISQAGLFWILFGVFLLLSIVYIAKKAKGNLGNDPFNKRFKTIKNDFDYTQRIARRNFGKSSEVSELLDEISREIASIERRRRAAESRNFVIWSVIQLLLVGAAAYGVHAMNRSLNEPQLTEQSTQTATTAAAAPTSSWDRLIREYDAMSPSDPGIERKRVEIVETLLAEGNPARAEEFFLDRCMGEIRDYDCATPIVLYYVGKSDQAAATAFVDRCTSLRYKSDAGKLKKLIK